MLVVLLSVALSLTSCAPHPPRVTLGFVVDLGVGPADTSDYLYHPSEPLDSVIEAYSKASGDSFYSETTPSLVARMMLRDGTVVSLHFSTQFPRDRLVVAVAPREMEESEWYKVTAPGLLEAIWELAGDHLDRQALDQNRDWLPE